MKKNFFLIITIFLINLDFSFASNHYPITTESKIMIERGKLAYIY